MKAALEVNVIDIRIFGISNLPDGKAGIEQGFEN